MADINKLYDFIKALDAAKNPLEKGKLINKHPDLFRQMVENQAKARGIKIPNGQDVLRKIQVPQLKGFEGKPKVTPQQNNTPSRFKGFEKPVVGNAPKPTPKVQPQQAGKFAKEMDILFNRGNVIDNTIEGAVKSPAGKKVVEGLSKIAPKVLPQASKLVPGIGAVLGALGTAQSAYEVYRALQDRPQYDFVGGKAPDSVKALTPEEQKKVKDYQQVITTQPKVTEDNPQQFLADVMAMGKDIPDVNSLPSAPQIRDYIPTNNQLAAVQGPGTGFNNNGNINTPNIGLTPLNEPPSGANINQGENVMGNQTPNNLMAYMSMIGALTGGTQKGLQNPNLAPDQATIDAYRAALDRQDVNAQANNQQIENLKGAIAKDRANQDFIEKMNAIGSLLPGSRTETYRQYVPWSNAVDEFSIQRGREFIPTTPTNKNTERALVDAQLTQQQRQQLVDIANQRARLLDAINTSAQTGIPLQQVMDMKTSDYIDYIKPTQEASRDVTINAAKALNDLIKANQAGDILTGQQTQKQTADYNQALMEQQYKAATEQAKINKDIDIAMANNRTKMEVAKQLGTNSLELEKLKQADPNAYYRAIGNILMGASYFPQLGPQANQLGAQLFANILGNDNQDQQQGGGYYNGINFNY